MTAAKKQYPLKLVGSGVAAIVLAFFFMWQLPRITGDALVRADEEAAVDALRKIHLAELEWRRSDGDGNAVPDFWTGDVSGLYRAARPDGQPAAMLEGEIAQADRAPLGPTQGARPRLTEPLPVKPWRGYWLRALRNFATDGPDDDTNAWENVRSFGFAAFPAEPGVSGKRMFLVGEDGVVWAKVGAEPAEWPAKGPEAEGWTKVE